MFREERGLCAGKPLNALRNGTHGAQKFLVGDEIDEQDGGGVDSQERKRVKRQVFDEGIVPAWMRQLPIGFLRIADYHKAERATRGEGGLSIDIAIVQAGDFRSGEGARHARGNIFRAPKDLQVGVVHQHSPNPLAGELFAQGRRQ